MLYNRILTSLQSFTSPFQHGFVRKRSTVTNLVAFTQFVSEVLDRNGQVDVNYTDFAKAFDRVQHDVLLHKLSNYGLDEGAIRLLDSYLSKRDHFVSYNGYSSVGYFPSSGIPQGSNLGPLLFILFINDLLELIHCGRLCYADDLKMFSIIRNVDDCVNLQLQLMLSWCEQNKLRLNVDKCKIMTFSRRTEIYSYDYECNGRRLERHIVLRDLGVLFDTELSFVEHISQIILDAAKVYGFMIRNCRDFTEINCLKILYNAVIRSKLEYPSVVWSPICI